MYKNWKILKTDLEDKIEEYTQVSEWCNTNQKYHIEEDDKYYKVVPNPEPTEDELKERVRKLRNHYLELYIDPVVSNPLRWEDLTETEKQVYKNYRRYLLDYTESENWWLSNPLTFDEWKSQL